MKLLPPQPFTLEGNHRAILLLHGFTRQYKRRQEIKAILNKQGYTCHAPMTGGHGVSPEEILKLWCKILVGRCY